MSRKLWVLAHNTNVLEGKMDKQVMKAHDCRKITTDEPTWISAHSHVQRTAKSILMFVNIYQIKITNLIPAKRSRKIEILI